MLLRFISVWLVLPAVAFALPDLPGWEKIERPESTGATKASKGSQTTRGRLGQKATATLIKEGRLTWKPAATEAKAMLVEFWLKPVEWDAWQPARVPLTRIKSGGVVYEVVKPADTSELHLLGPVTPGEPDGTLQLYPLYGWDEARWMKGLPRKRPFQKSVGWHHFAWHLSDSGVAFYVDGFPARTIEKGNANAKPSGSSDSAPSPLLEEFTLEGAPGTAFESLSATALPEPLSAAGVRQRYLTSLRAEPDFETDHLTVPLLSPAPVVDGQWSEEEWQGAARLTGFGSYKEHRLLGEEVKAYLGYDDKALYVAVVMPDRKQPAAQTLDLVLGPPFVSGEEPRKLFKFVGALSGDRQSSRVLPTRQEDLGLPWDWKVSRSKGKLIAEAALPFGEPGIPERPAPGELWSWNLASKQGDFAWIAPGKLGIYDTLQEIGTLRFEQNGTAARPGSWAITDGALEIALDLQKAPAKAGAAAEAELRLYTEGEVFPASSQRWTVTAPSMPVSLPLAGSEGGWATLELRDSSGLLYRHSVRLPARKKTATPSKSKP